jgi:hypothetical protein
MAAVTSLPILMDASIVNDHVNVDLKNYQIPGTPIEDPEIVRTFRVLNTNHPWVVNFDGVNDIVNCQNDATLWSQSLTKFSFSCWIYPTAGWDGNFRWVVEHNGSSQGFKCQISGDTANRIIFTIKNAGGTFIDSFNNTLQLNQWNFITCVYDNSLGSGNIKIYVNTVVGTNANLTEAINLSAALTLSESSTDFKGNMKDFRWYTTKALNTTEITDIYNNSGSAPTPNYWLPMNEGTGNPLDSISKTKVGTLTNGATWTADLVPTVDPYITVKYFDNELTMRLAQTDWDVVDSLWQTL